MGSVGEIPPLFALVQPIASNLERHAPIGSFIANQLQFSNLIDLLNVSDRPAIFSPTGTTPVTHRQLRTFVSELNLSRFGLAVGDRVGVLLPDGPELGCCILSLMALCTCAPMNPTNTAEEIRSDLARIQAKAAIVGGDFDPAKLRILESCGIKTMRLLPALSSCGLFSLEGEELAAGAPRVEMTLNSPSDTALVLFTSGTSGTKKIVPYSLKTLMVGTACVAASWALGPNDVNLNMMPLFHVGGIVRNLLAPVLTGGATVLCSGFDASLFCDLIQSSKATWYYAAPTMHHAILQQFALRKPVPKHCIRMICNAAGALLPSLATHLRDTFGGAVVLPSYGMTECMPISAPPITYALERPGTSGRAVGPELAICDDQWRPIPPGSIGNIVVRGSPVFAGYEGDSKANESAFAQDGSGWFNTGDMGYLDTEGYLYITGRSKEVINRGGEIISPMEVEEAVSMHPNVKASLAFVVQHDTLQEAVGIALVMKSNATRPDLSSLQRFLQPHLHPSKFPVVIVYIDDLPKNQANKLLRIRLGERLGLPTFTDGTAPLDRLFEAMCPPKNAPLSQPINCVKVGIDDYRAVLDQLSHLPGHASDIYDAAVIAPPALRGALVAYVALRPRSTIAAVEDSDIAEEIQRALVGKLHDYLVPKHIVLVDLVIPRRDDGSPSLDVLPQPFLADNGQTLNPTEKLLRTLFRQVLKLEVPIAKHDDFFELGGNSLAAGLLFALIQKRARVSLAVNTIYSHRTIESLAKLIDSSRPKGSLAPRYSSRYFTRNITPSQASVATATLEKESPAWNQCNPVVLLAQLLPLLLLQPLRLTAKWLVFIGSLALLIPLFDSFHHWALRYAHLIAAMIMVRAVTTFLFPLVGIAAKWLIIGRYRQGRFPLWGPYYLRWWIVAQFLGIFGHGVFGWTNTSRVWYYRLLGAEIGKNVNISGTAQLSEFDLLHFGDNCRIDVAAICRPFRLEVGLMALQRIRLNENVIVGRKTVISSGANVPAGTVFGPLSSSHESSDASASYGELCSLDFPSPSWLLLLFVGYPLVLFVRFLSFLPWLIAMYPALTSSFRIRTNESNFYLIIVWFTQFNRFPYRMLARCASNLLAPCIVVLMTVLLKALLFRRPAREGVLDRSQWALLKSWMLQKLLPGKDLAGISHIIGTHYEGISVVYRMLGAKVGERVYWPGSGLETHEFDQLEIGNDVVFGSRSHVMCSDANICGKVRIHDGAMVADRCVLLPGSTIGRACVLGSGGLAKKNTSYPPESVWVGSKAGNAVLWDLGNSSKTDKYRSTVSPFGRAFYLREAPYFVFPLWFHILTNVLAESISTFYWMLPINGAALILVHILNHHFIPTAELSVPVVCGLMLCMMLVLVPVLALLALGLEVALKWALVGRRHAGDYDWDRSSYCQRWQIYLSLLRIRTNCFSGRGVLNHLLGSFWLCLYFRAMGATIGRNVCLYPNGGDPMMTEPDLVKIGDDSGIDDASLVCHRNTRGHFSLDPLVVGKGCVMRCSSRLLSGASMESYSTLLEHTLLVSGAIAPAGTFWQGWPAAETEVPLCERNILGSQVSL